MPRGRGEPRHEAHGRRQVRRRQVGAAIVGVADDDLVGAAGETAFEHGVEVASHEPPGAFVGRAAGFDLVFGDHAGAALEVDADEQLHGVSRRAAPSADGLGGGGAAQARGVK